MGGDPGAPPVPGSATRSPVPGERPTLETVKRAYTLEVLRLSRGQHGKAARILGIDRRTLTERLRRLDD